jgi:putative phosphoesterase
MRIAVTADLHYDLIRTEEDLEELVKLITALTLEHPDVLIIAGDTVGLGWPRLPEIFKLLSPVAPERLFVLGNHEYWSADRDTFNHLETLAGMIQAGGFHLLDNGPKVIGNIGFAGNCGWYDYSFAQNNPPHGISYEDKLFKGDVIWNDAHMVNLNQSDREYTKHLLVQLEADILELENQVDTIVTVTHLIGFQEMAIQYPDDPLWNFINAYLGSNSLGDLLLRHPKVKYHLCGHTHRPAKIVKAHLTSINVGSDYHRKEYQVLEI